MALSPIATLNVRKTGDRVIFPTVFDEIKARGSLVKQFSDIS